MYNNITCFQIVSVDSWSSVTDSSGAYLIDRSPVYFEPLLNYLRHGVLVIDEGVNPQGISLDRF